jgi:hypothetical protein
MMGSGNHPAGWFGWMLWDTVTKFGEILPAIAGRGRGGLGPMSVIDFR